MSLINDALKRAKAAQQHAPPPAASLEFRPVDPAEKPRHSYGPIVVGAIAVIVVLAALLAWQLTKKDGSSRIESRTTEAPTQNPTIAEAKTPTPIPAAEGSATIANIAPASSHSSTVSPSPVHSDAAPASSQTTTREEARTPASQPPVREETHSVTAAPAILAPSTPAPAAPEPAKPAPRLQAIVFNPSRPSAMISGRTVFIGDRFGEWRVVAINQQSATLVGAGQTNVLSLPQ